ncbi:MAG: hypothetical protein AAGH79_07175 [Bacteroidota bacterium]
MYKLFIFFAFICTSPLWAQQTEILIVGTLHDVEPEQADNYHQLLEQIRPWKPTVICTEYRKPTDTVSLKAVFGDDIFDFQDSLAKTWKVNLKTLLSEIRAAKAKVQTMDNLENRIQLAKLYHVHQDRGNAFFQYYHICHQFQQLTKDQQEQWMLKEPYLERILNFEKRNSYDEYWLLAYPLAIEQNIDYLYPTDDQTDRDVYHQAWGKANEELADHPLTVEFQSLYDSLITISFGSLNQGTAGIRLNQLDVQEMLYRLEADFYPPGLSSSSDLRNYYWIKRNERMAKHVLQVAEQHPNQRIVVFYGGSHVPAIRRQLRALSDHRILTLPDLPQN